MTELRSLQADAFIEVPFHDVDAMQVCWHGNYLKYFEAGRAALLRAFDYDYPAMRVSGYAWPIVECQLKFVRPAVYGQTLKILATLIEHENRLKIAYEITDASTGVVLTKGHTVQVAIEEATGALQFVSPAIVFDNLERVWSRSA
ncbi:thioesterase family protein [Caballeronia sp. LZ001]|uniref:acyl-CoA thioesterase n=1 Tax=Caballeronia sp. LZ001 TaxID=3038553 RepID=UPI0028579D1A|nr:thioesterase family protein [Caballeronia sp. LZ001]MDR5801395.1 thioesterase family protein [Caballeronia sp. LZ001]